MRRFSVVLLYWGPVLAWAGLIASLSHIPSLETGAPGAWDLVVRKIGHVGEFGVLTFLLWRALRAQGWAKSRVLIWSGIGALAFAASDEFHQSFIPGREGAVRDVLIDSIGIAAWLGLSRFASRIPLLSLAGNPQED
jgi:VanZ family protein